jgi:L-2-hydroxyglutarate oxidase
LTPAKTGLVRAHLYATPDLEFPFLKVHFSKTITADVTIGPGAVLAAGRHAYDSWRFNLADVTRMLSFKGFWRMLAAREFRQMAAQEWRKSLFKVAVFEEARKLIPKLEYSDLIPYRSGIRAQLVNAQGDLIDDLVVEQTHRSIHILNAVSPALTCSLPFADHIVSILASK